MIELLVDRPWTLDILAVLLGLILGSFLNVCIYRLPRELSVVRPRSCCPSCNRMIAWFDNLPLLSYLLLRGKCRHCGTGIPIRYPLVEGFTGLISWLLFCRFGLGVAYPVYFLYAASLLVVSVIDLDHRIIPDQISLSGIVIGLLLAAFTPVMPFLDSLAGFALGGGSLLLVGMAYEAVRKQEGIGGGDIKLLAMIGAFFGWPGVLFTIFTASLTGTLAGMAVILRQRADMKLAVPFGPFLAIGAIGYVFIGPETLAWYLQWMKH